MTVRYIFDIDNTFLLTFANEMSSHQQQNINAETTVPPSISKFDGTFYRKLIHAKNHSYYAYNIQIGKLLILTQNLSVAQIEEMDNKLSNNSIKNKLGLNKNSKRSQKMREIWHLYFGDTGNQSTGQSECCHEKMDFFDFIQYDNEQTNNPKLHIFASLPVEQEIGYNESEYFATNYSLDFDYHSKPRLFSYTLSMHRNKSLQSLQFRFVEMHKWNEFGTMKHLMLNKVRNYLLWSGECYFFYDYAFGKYVFVMDNNSGHWKPLIEELPNYLEEMLTNALFPTFAYNDKKKDYQPLKMIDRHEKPWRKMRKFMFSDIYKGIKERDRKKKKAKKQNETKSN